MRSGMYAFRPLAAERPNAARIEPRTPIRIAPLKGHTCCERSSRQVVLRCRRGFHWTWRHGRWRLVSRRRRGRQHSCIGWSQVSARDLAQEMGDDKHCPKTREKDADNTRNKTKTPNQIGNVGE